MNLRPYQLAAIAAARDHVRTGKRAVLFVSPTGSGKTVIGSAIVRNHLSRGEGRAVLWAAHRTELIEQAARTLTAQGLAVGWGGLHASAPVQVRSIQTILAQGEAPPGTLLCLDEAHHYAASEWAALPKLFAHAFRIGLSATPERGDGRGLGDLFDSVVVVAQIRELIEAGHLAACDVLAPKRILDRSLAQSPVDAWRKHGDGRRAVVFASTLAAATQYADEFRAKGHTAEVVSGVMAADKRRGALARFEAGKLDAICNLHVLTEGWDAPIAKVAILARKFGSAGAYLQAVGRVLRTYQDQRATVIDLYGSNVADHGAPDEDRTFELEGVAIRRLSDPVESFCRIHQIPRDADGKCPECGDVSREVQLPGVAGVELDKWAAVPADRRVHVLAGLIKKGRARGSKPIAARVAFKAMFKHWPSTETWDAAMRRAGG
jgi:superfamily II DNA or RNA helicase